MAAAGALGQPVYTWTDASGEVHYTNDAQSIPKSARAREVKTDESVDDVVFHSTPTPTPTDPAPADSATAVMPARPAPRAEPLAAFGSAASEQTLLESIARTGWRPSPELEHDAANAPAFVRLADTSADPRVITAALAAMDTLHSPNPGAGATYNGTPYTRVPCTEAYYRVVLRRLDHEDWHVRSAAALAAGQGAWGPKPREDVLAALGQRLEREEKPEVWDLVASSLWSCHCARPVLVTAALKGVESGHSQYQVNGLARMGLVGKKGRTFDAAARARMRRAAEPFLGDDSLQLRRSALEAWVATTADAPSAVLARLSSAAKDRHPFVRNAAVQLIGQRGGAPVLPVLLESLSDLESGDLTAPGAPPLKGRPTIADGALFWFERISAEVLGDNGFKRAAKGAHLSATQMANEAARARAWYAKNQKFLAARR